MNYFGMLLIPSGWLCWHLPRNRVTQVYRRREEMSEPVSTASHCRAFRITWQIEWEAWSGMRKRFHHRHLVTKRIVRSQRRDKRRFWGQDHWSLTGERLVSGVSQNREFISALFENLTFIACDRQRGTVWCSHFLAEMILGVSENSLFH